jgi:hypothetical protein
MFVIKAYHKVTDQEFIIVCKDFAAYHKAINKHINNELLPGQCSDYITHL